MPIKILAVIASVGLVGCASPFLSALPEWTPIAAPDTSKVESVLFLVGDAGNVKFERSPLLNYLAADVEAWSAALRRDSAAIIVYLGDNVYPDGIRDGTDPSFREDSARLHAQLEPISGPFARKYASAAFFVPGNHDWGNLRGTPGVLRLKNEEAFLDRRRERGLNARLLPSAGEPGPAEVDFGSRLRLLFIDSAWWLFNYTSPQKTRMLVATDQAMRSSGNRTVLMFAHHPLQSGGAHGGLVPFWEGIGVRYLLARSGTLLQDLNSIPYQGLHAEMETIFKRTKIPFVFVGGHDHSLQVIKATEEGDPHFMLASGSASKLTAVGDAKGQLFRKASPGYMKLVVKRDGTLDLYVVATGNEFLKCDQLEVQVQADCIKKGIGAFETVYSMHLTPTTPGP